MAEKKKGSWGGRRAGAGRKADQVTYNVGKKGNRGIYCSKYELICCKQLLKLLREENRTATVADIHNAAMKQVTQNERLMKQIND